VAEEVGWDSSLVALSLIADVLADCAALGSCVGIAESEEKSGRRCEVRSVAQICKLIKTLRKAAMARWICFGLDSRDWRTTALIVDYPYAEQGMGGKSK
jgi:hypothetical protein